MHRDLALGHHGGNRLLTLVVVAAGCGARQLRGAGDLTFRPLPRGAEARQLGEDGLADVQLARHGTLEGFLRRVLVLLRLGEGAHGLENGLRDRVDPVDRSGRGGWIG